MSYADGASAPHAEAPGACSAPKHPGPACNRIVRQKFALARRPGLCQEARASRVWRNW
ncbi:protein of unknown function [Methylorubrum extorquens]|uniref:Uncharacterized protein n=1 Tax=Methylorubrum extorquens TaxID=408 RepID=A0A2N9AXX4_METEX|nr:protein of unknown function [Methylorubrum extorquens]